MQDCFIREHYEDRQSWLTGRERIKGSTGASSAAVLVGLSKHVTIDEYYEEKIGLRSTEDLSHNRAVQYGVAAEEHIRQLVALDLADKYTVDYHPFDILRLSSAPYIFATLDGELTRLSDGKKGVLEIKTGRLSKTSLDEWSSAHVPMQYFAQNCQQLLVTGWSYCIDVCRLYKLPDEADKSLPEIVWIYRYIDAKKKEVRESMQYIAEAAYDFHDCVINNIRPSTLLRWQNPQPISRRT